MAVQPSRIGRALRRVREPRMAAMEGGRGARCAPLPAVGGGGGAAGRLWQFLEPPLLPAGACRGRSGPAVPPGAASRMEAAAPVAFIGACFAAGVGRDCRAVVVLCSLYAT